METTAQHWSSHTASYTGRNAGLFWWEAGPELHRHIDWKITGNPVINWVPYTLSKYFGDRLPLARCLSLGCGDGFLERGLARCKAFDQCDAYDVAEGSLEIARKLATDEGFNNINYSCADINNIALPASTYDSVWIHSMCASKLEILLNLKVY